MGGSSERLMTHGTMPDGTQPRRRPRRCVGCGKEDVRANLLRVVRSPDGTVQISVSGKAPGRGAYVCADLACVRMARKKNALSRALKQPVETNVYERLEALCHDDASP